MMGIEVTACACAACGCLVDLKRSLSSDDPPPPAVCPDCGGPVRVVASGQDETDQKDGPIACPVCQHPLDVEFVGVWD